MTDLIALICLCSASFPSPNYSRHAPIFFLLLIQSEKKRQIDFEHFLNAGNRAANGRIGTFGYCFGAFCKKLRCFEPYAENDQFIEQQTLFIFSIAVNSSESIDQLLGCFQFEFL